MSSPPDPHQRTAEAMRIGVLYSYAPHFRQAVQALRRQYPEAHITALIPPDFPVETFGDSVNATIPCAPAPHAPRSMEQSWRVLRTLRQQPFDLFVVLFNSTKLQLLAGMSRATDCAWFQQDGTLQPMRMRLVSTLCAGMVRRIRGQLLYWKIWRHVRMTPIAPPPGTGTNDSPKTPEAKP